MFQGMDLNDLLSKAQELQKNLQKGQEDVSQKTAEASVGGGMVKTVMNGNLELVSLEIDPEVIKVEDKETLEDLVRAAVNENIKKAKELGGGGSNLNDMFSNFDLSKLAGLGFPPGGKK